MELYDLLPEQGEPLSAMRISLIRQDFVGAFFCLWRGVFLAHDKESNPGEPVQHAKDYLKKIIQSSTILFGDDQKSNEWTANFYVDGADRILAGFPSSDISQATSRCESISPPWKIEDYPSPIKDRWKYNHSILKRKIESFRNELNGPESKKPK